MRQIILLLVSVLILAANAQNSLKVVRLSQEREAWLAGNRQKALDLLLAQEAKGDLELSTLYNIGYLYFLKGDHNRAMTYFQTVIVKESDFPYAYLQIARIYRNIGNLHAAQDRLENGLDEDSDNIQLLLEMAEIDLELNKLQLAEDSYRNARNIDEDNVYALVGLAKVLRLQGKLDEAVEVLDANESIYPEALLLQEKAEIYHAIGEKNKAKEYLTQIVLDYPNSQTWRPIREKLANQFGVTKFPEPEPLAVYTYTIDATEELDYKVTYGPMTLGWLKVRTGKPEFIDSTQVYPITFFVDTNPSYGFIISLHHIYESHIDPRTLNAVKSRLYTPGNDDYLARVYNFYYDKNIFTSHTITPDGRFTFVQKDLPRRVQDSTSMLYYARGLVSDKLNGTTAVVIDENYKYGHVKFLNETEQIESDGKMIDAIKIFARAEFKGVAGMNGDAWGLFNPDDQAKPLEGSVEIIVGSIILEVDPEKTVIPNFHNEED
jgi:tetratricopeptide (TPR) repeat protein